MFASTLKTLAGKLIWSDPSLVRVTSISVLKDQPSDCTSLLNSARVDLAVTASTGSVPVKLFIGASAIAANIMLIASSSVVAATAIV